MKPPSGKVVKAKVMKASPKVMKASPNVMKAGKKPAVSAMSRKPAAEPGPGRKTGGKMTPLPEKKVDEEGDEEEDLGVASYIYGNLLAALMNSMGMGRVKALVGLNKMIATKYQHLGIQSGNRLPRLNVSDIFTDDFPCLRHVKGRRVRKFALVATKLAASLATNVRGKRIHALRKCMEEVCSLCDRKQFVWNAEAGQEFADTCEALLAHYSW